MSWPIELSTELTSTPQTNILINEKGRACLSDVGLTKAMAPGQTPIGLTITGAFPPAVQWCSPELLQTQNVATGSDMWAFGCCLLEVSSVPNPVNSLAINTI